MATKIIATRKKYDPTGDHRHVDSILTMDRRVFTRAEAVQRIDNGWEAFYTVYDGVQANVYTKQCGHCSLRFITTTPDGTRYNNLLSLPDF